MFNYVCIVDNIKFSWIRYNSQMRTSHHPGPSSFLGEREFYTYLLRHNTPQMWIQKKLYRRKGYIVIFEIKVELNIYPRRPHSSADEEKFPKNWEKNPPMRFNAKHPLIANLLTNLLQSDQNFKYNSKKRHIVRFRTSSALGFLFRTLVCESDRQTNCFLEKNSTLLGTWARIPATVWVKVIE